MRRHTHSGSENQIPLALSLMPSPEITSVLHTAYSRLELSRRLSFEQVMADRIYAIGVRNLAEAILRPKIAGNSGKGTLGASEIGKAMGPLPEFRSEINYSGAE